jgi:putative modified peptide
MSESRVALTVGLAKVLHKLGIDDKFRAEFQKDPNGALKRHGIETGKIGTVDLPSKEDLQKGFAEFLDGALSDSTSQMAFGSKPPGPTPPPHKP